MPGPPPKRSDQRRRRNKPDESQPKLTVVKDEVPRAAVKAPRVSPSWHPLMKDWFRSLKESRQAQLYEPSDWQTARLLAEVMSQELNSEKGVKATMLAEFNSAAGSLLTTEGERRRLRVEFQGADEAAVDDESSSVMSHYRELFL